MSKLLEQINKELKTYQISDLAGIKYGFGLPDRDRIKGSVPVYASSGVVGFHDKAKVDKPAIIIGRKGNVGSLYYSETPSHPIDTAFFIDEPKEGFDIKFIFYLLKRINLPRYGGDSAVPGLSRDTIYSLSVKVPSLPTQKKIVEILSAYDSKIENNNKIIKNLEVTAQAIFNEWFVKFRFPGYEKVKFINSEMNKIPDGWEVVSLRDIFTFIKGKKPLITSNVQTEGFLPQILIGGFDTAITTFADKRNMVIATDEDLLMVMDGASSGRVEFGFHGVVGSTISKLSLKKDIKSILFFFLKTKEKDIRENTIGSAIPHTDKEKVYSYKIVIPKEYSIYEGKLFSFIKDIESVKKENLSLKNLRDRLLIKLI